jgi:hypothetical protein
MAQRYEWVCGRLQNWWRLCGLIKRAQNEQHTNRDDAREGTFTLNMFRQKP